MKINTTLLSCICILSCSPAHTPSAEMVDGVSELPVENDEAPSPTVGKKRPAEPELRAVDLTWYEQAEILCDRATLAESFTKMGYKPMAGSYLVAARVLEGGDQPAFEYYSLGDTAFAHSDGRFWPASTIKLMAAVGALSTLSKYGLNGDAYIDLTDARSRYRGSVAGLYQNAIIHSNNLAYDRLVMIAGFDELNDSLLTPENGFPTMTLQCPYYPGVEEPSLRTSPSIIYKQRKLEGEIPARHSNREHNECPGDANCTTLFELLDGLRRVMLHDELPIKDRFPLHKKDVKRLHAHLLEAKNKLEPGVSKALGHPVRVYNKAGRVPGADQNDHALVVDEVTGARYLVALSVPDTLRSDEKTQEKVMELASNALKVLAGQAGTGVLLRRDGGLPIKLEIAPSSSEKGTYSITALLDGEVDKLILWRNRDILTETDGGAIETKSTIPKEGHDLLVVQAERNGKVIGYRTLAVTLVADSLLSSVRDSRRAP
ncbi:MAG: serine hydrolase [Deltaproteobacteria bacterium]|nr:serine hydrolase [Deltaproteobacteria bacterium]